MRVIGLCSPDDDAPADLASSDGAARTTWLSTTREFRYFPQQVKLHRPVMLDVSCR